MYEATIGQNANEEMQASSQSRLCCTDALRRQLTVRCVWLKCGGPMEMQQWIIQSPLLQQSIAAMENL